LGREKAIAFFSSSLEKSNSARRKLVNNDEDICVSKEKWHYCLFPELPLISHPDDYCFYNSLS
jgi:hypothetical protein